MKHKARGYAAGFSASCTPAIGQAMQVSGALGVLGQHRTGRVTVNAALLGQTLSVAIPGTHDVLGGYAGVALEWSGSSGWSLFTAADYTIRNDSSRIVTGRAGMRLTF